MLKLRNNACCLAARKGCNKLEAWWRYDLKWNSSRVRRLAYLSDLSFAGNISTQQGRGRLSILDEQWFLLLHRTGRQQSWHPKHQELGYHKHKLARPGDFFAAEIKQFMCWCHYRQDSASSIRATRCLRFAWGIKNQDSSITCNMTCHASMVFRAETIGFPSQPCKHFHASTLVEYSLPSLELLAGEASLIASWDAMSSRA